jgi:hypothetical protein
VTPPIAPPELPTDEIDESTLTPEEQARIKRIKANTDSITSGLNLGPVPTAG